MGLSRLGWYINEHGHSVEESESSTSIFLASIKMHFSSFVLPALAANLLGVAALPRPQDLDLDMVDAAPDPTYTQAVGVTAQVVTVDASAVAAQVTEAVTSVSIDVDEVLSATAIVGQRKAKRTACQIQPTGANDVSNVKPTADTASAWAAMPNWAAKASSVAAPAGYDTKFTALTGASNA